MNPMIRKELDQRMRERRGWVLPSLYLVTLGAVVLLAYSLTLIDRGQMNKIVQGSTIGVVIYVTSVYAQLTLLLLLAPVFSAGAITIEKEQRTLAALLVSLLTRQEIWFGKFISSLMFVVLLVCASIPIVSMAFAFGGFGAQEVVTGLVTTVIILGAVSAIGLYWSSALRRSMHATAITYATIIGLTVVSFIIFLAISITEHVGYSWPAMPLSHKLPLYFNPYYFMTTAFLPWHDLYPEWVRCAVVFVLIAALASFGAVWNLRRGGEAT